MPYHGERRRKMKKLIVLNHKMGMLYDEVYYYIDKLNNINTDNDIIVCPSSIYMEAFVNNCDYPVGAQNVSYEEDINNTGEISTIQLKSMGVEYSLVGHYERISKYNENEKVVNEKLLSIVDANIFPILCFGEAIDEDYKTEIPRLLDAYLKEVENIEFIIFAYEPEYAVGTGTLPSIDRIKEVTKFISKYLEDKYKRKPTLLYGGSVDSSNVKDIINIEEVDGVLVGATSSNIMEVEKIINNVR